MQSRNSFSKVARREPNIISDEVDGWDILADSVGYVERERVSEKETERNRERDREREGERES